MGVRVERLTKQSGTLQQCSEPERTKALNAVPSNNNEGCADGIVRIDLLAYLRSVGADIDNGAMGANEIFGTYLAQGIT